VARPLTMTFVNCTFQMVDRYVKVSDTIPMGVLAQSTHIPIEKGASLEEAWKQIVSAGYFETFQMATQNRDPGSPRQRVRMARLGDGQRLAILPDGTKATEKDIQEGLVPGAEYSLPMMVGAFFKITLTPVSEGREHVGVHMRFDAEYRATGVALKPGESLTGVEQGTFAREGNAFVAARRVEAGAKSGAAGRTPNALGDPVDDTWSTDECGDKNGLVSNAVQVDPNGPAEGSTSSLYFERVVIGSPGGASGAIAPQAGPALRARRNHK